MYKVIALPEGGRGVRILMALFLCAYKAAYFKKTGIFTSRWGAW